MNPEQQAMPQQPAEMPQAPQTMSSMPMDSSGKPKMLIGGIAAVALVVLGVAGFLLYTMFLSPAAQAKRASTAFMHAITANKTSDAMPFTTASSDDEKAFITSSAGSVHGSYKLNSKAFQSGKGYFLYGLSGATSKYARTTVEKSGGKWLVSSFVYSTKQLALIPGSGATESNTQATANNATSSQVACLQKSDFNQINHVNSGNVANDTGSMDYSKTGLDESQYFTAITYFLPDSLNFDPAADTPDLTSTDKVQSVIDFYKANSSKPFSIHLYGVVALTGQADLEFGTQRSQKIAGMLEAGGIPKDRIEVQTSQNIATYNGGTWANNTSDPVAKQLARSVSMVIVPGDCSATGTGR